MYYYDVKRHAFEDLLVWDDSDPSGSVKQSEYISKKQALKEQTEAMGTDPEEFLGYNPFTASIEIKRCV